MKKWSIQVAHLQQHSCQCSRITMFRPFIILKWCAKFQLTGQVCIAARRIAGLVHTSATWLWVTQCGYLPLQEQQARFLWWAVAVYCSVVLLGTSEFLDKYSPVLRICCHSFYFCKTLISGTFPHTHLLLWVDSDVAFNEDTQKEYLFLWELQDTLFCLDCLLITAAPW